MIEYINAKKVMDFYLGELEKIMPDSQAAFAMQLDQLKAEKYSSECALTALESYDIEVQ